VKLFLAGAAIAAAALVAAGPAAADSAQATGTIMTNGTQAMFTLDYTSGLMQKVVFVDRSMHLSFHSTTLSSVQVLPYVVKITGTGIANGRRVSYVAIATHHPSPTGDWFRIDWSGVSSMGGKLRTGSVKIDALIASVAGTGG
jgi:hypothetical protein